MKERMQRGELYDCVMLDVAPRAIDERDAVEVPDGAPGQTGGAAAT